MNPIQWAKNNKLTTLLILVVLYFVFFRGPTPYTVSMRDNGIKSYGIPEMDSGLGAPVFDSIAPSVGQRIAPTDYNESASPSPDRRVVSETFLSLQVADVPKAISDIKSKAQSLKGFMVSSNVTRPEEAASGSITIRVPIAESDQMVAYLKENSIKVVNEDTQGRDITDQYSDVETRLATLQKNRSRIEAIMDQANTVDEILRVQTQLFQLQDQIDSLIGQRDYLKNTSDSVKITAYLATDEFALPYVPDTSWRPEVIFKEAVRSLIMDIRSLGNKVIWFVVYGVIWIPALIIFMLVRKNWSRISGRFYSNNPPSGV